MSAAPTSRGRRIWRVLLLFLLLARCAAAAGVWLYQDYQRFTHAPLASDGQARIIDIPRGQGFRGVVGNCNSKASTAACTNFTGGRWRGSTRPRSGRRI